MLSLSQILGRGRIGSQVKQSLKASKRERRLLTSELTLLLVVQAPTLSKVKLEMTLYLVELVVIV